MFHEALRQRGSHQERHRIVEPRFEFEDRAGAFLQLNALASNDQKDRSGVRRRQDRA